MRAAYATPALLLLALPVNVRLVLLAMLATVPIAVSLARVITTPTESSVKNAVPDPATVIEAVELVIVPVRVVVQVAFVFELPAARLDAVAATVKDAYSKETAAAVNHASLVSHCHRFFI